MAREPVPANARLPLLPATAATRTGWAASFGATVPAPVTGEDDEISVQATYAVDASAFLGTGVDLSWLAAVVPTAGPTRGWSVVASYSHAWSKGWESKPAESLRLGAEIGWLKADLAANGAVGVPLRRQRRGHGRLSQRGMELLGRDPERLALGLDPRDHAQRKKAGDPISTNPTSGASGPAGRSSA